MGTLILLHSGKIIIIISTMYLPMKLLLEIQNFILAKLPNFEKLAKLANFNYVGQIAQLWRNWPIKLPNFDQIN